MRRHPAIGFTLIEVLVALATMMTLLMIAMPAIQHSRVHALRAKCENNLRLIGQAFTKYENTFKYFPCGGAEIPGLMKIEMKHSWLLAMLPQLGHQDIFDQYNFHFGIRPADPDGRVEINRTAYSQVITTFLCPTDSAPVNNGFNNNTVGRRNNYLGSLGPKPNNNNACLWGGSPGLLGLLVHYQLEQVTDGLSQTILASEGLAGMGNTQQVRYRGNTIIDSAVLPVGTSTSNAFDNVQGTKDLIDECNRLFNEKTIFSRGRGSRWANGATGQTLFNTIQLPNDKAGGCRWDTSHYTSDETDQADLLGASSEHGGGVNVLMGDGHVVWVEDKIDMMVWWGMGTRCGFETIPPFPTSK